MYREMHRQFYHTIIYHQFVRMRVRQELHWQGASLSNKKTQVINISFHFIHFWAHLCNLHGGLICIAFCLSFCPWLDQNYWTITHISKSIAPRVMKCCQCMGVDDPEVDLEDQGHRSKVKVTMLKTWFLVSSYILISQCIEVKVTWVEVKGHLGQDQGSRSAKPSRYWQVGSHQRQVASL